MEHSVVRSSDYNALTVFEGSMKPGNLYKVKTNWAPTYSAGEFWSTCGPVLYLGEDVIEREDGLRIVNHAVLVKGQRRILDRSFLKFLEPLTKT